MLAYAKSNFSKIDLAGLPLDETLSLIRRQSLDEFGELLLHLPSNELPHLTELFPEMETDAIQKQWTGSSGMTLLRQSINFMNFVSTQFCLNNGRAFKSAKTLDFGCGWGRLLRLLPYFNDPEYCFGCDAWDVSLSHAKRCGVDKIASLQKSDPTPARLPYEDNSFDLVYAFSIFTHLSERSAKACMKAIHQATKSDGIAIITIRPVEFWSNHKNTLQKADIDQLISKHEEGFSFHPHGGITIDKNGSPVDYGDTSIHVDAIEKIFPGWKVLSAGTTLADMEQVFVTLRPLK